MFCCWCMENNEKKMSNTAFGKIVNTKYEKKRTKSGFVYDLEDMKTGVQLVYSFLVIFQTIHHVKNDFSVSIYTIIYFWCMVVYSMYSFRS